LILLKLDSGLLGGLFGIGGGIILVPFLVFYSEFNLVEASGISLFSIIGTSISVSQSKIREKLVNLDLAMRVEAIALVFGFFGSLLAYALPTKVVEISFATMTSVLLLVYIKKTKQTAVYAAHQGVQGVANEGEQSGKTSLKEDLNPQSLKNSSDKNKNSRSSDAKSTHFEPKNNIVFQSIIALAGLFAGLLGIGGGAIIVPLLDKFARIPLKMATATSAYIMGMTTMGGAFGHLTKAQFPFKAAVLALVGVRIGAKLGVGLSRYIPEKVLKAIFILLLMWISMKMWTKAL
jgi:uncharacterized membrane protein YfcA